ncbi:MAG: rubrerythrin [Peptococcaceae bacterium BICA1-7]|nr:MAG: rubrerythrin [Peptococcaceae bacterium BICA1-7]HBV97490.1 rubrerythrin [Desulfotomaculum sp.]
MSWSILNFTGEEIINLATEIEKAGKSFYEAAAQKVDIPEVSALFKALGNEEEKHIEDFQSLKKHLDGSFTPEESYPGEYRDYLKAIIDNHVFNIKNVDEFAMGAVVAREALAVALRFEKDSIMIFQEFMKVVDEPGRIIVQKLIDQEKEHIGLLARLNKIKW